MRKHEKSRADAFDRLARLQIELNDRRVIGTVAAIGAATSIAQISPCGPR